MPLNLDGNGLIGGLVQGFSKEYQSPLQSYTNGTTFTLNHGLGVIPKVARAEIICVTANNGIAVGDRIEIGGVDTNGNSTGIQIRKDATNLTVTVGSSGIYVINAAGTAALATAANFQVQVSAFA